MQAAEEMHFKGVAPRNIIKAFLMAQNKTRLPLVIPAKAGRKYVWARKLLSESGETEEGQLLQKKLLAELYKLRDLPDKGVEDRDDGLKALREFKTVVKLKQRQA